VLRFVRGDERFQIDREIEYGAPGASAAIDHVSVAITARGKTQRRRYSTVDAAARTYHETIAARLDDGFCLEIDGAAVTPAGAAVFASLPELERMVEDDPTTDHWHVLADAWCAADDPRGACIHAERALLGLGDPAEYVRRKAEAERWRRVRNGHVWGVLGRDAYRLRARFLHGLIDELAFDDELAAPGRPTGELLALALASPFALFTRTIRVAHGDEVRLAGVIAASPRAGRASLMVRDQ